MPLIGEGASVMNSVAYEGPQCACVTWRKRRAKWRAAREIRTPAMRRRAGSPAHEAHLALAEVSQVGRRGAAVEIDLEILGREIGRARPRQEGGLLPLE